MSEPNRVVVTPNFSNQKIEAAASVKAIVGGGGGGASDYTDLSNKPSINGVTLVGNKSLSALGITAPTPEVFWATYGTTTSAEIETAYQAGKAVLCNRNGYIYQLCSRASAAEHYFSTVKDEVFMYLDCIADVWGYDEVTALTQMPSASQVGAVALAQGSGNAGKFLIVGSDGNVTTVTMTAWAGGNY